MEAARAWGGPQSQWGRFAPAGTAMLREHLPGMAEALNIPPGGAGTYALGWTMTPEGPRYLGSQWDRGRIASTIAEMMWSGEIAPHEADVAAYMQTGEVFDEALQKHSVERFWPTLISWMGGPGFKPREEYEEQLTEMYDARERLRGLRNDPTVTAEQYRDAWRNLETTWPQYSVIMMGREENKADRLEALTWSVLDRQPPGWRYRVQFEEVAQERGIQLLDRWFDSKGNIAGWTDDDVRHLEAVVVQLAKEPYPSEQDRQEWAEYERLKTQLETDQRAMFPEAFAVRQAFFDAPQYVKDRMGSTLYDKYPEMEALDLLEQDLKEESALYEKYAERPPEHWTEGQAKSEFYDFYHEEVPPGVYEQDMRDAVPGYDALRDFETREQLEALDLAWEAKDYQRAIELGREHLENNPPPGDPGEWSQARAVNNQWWDIREEFWDDIPELQDKYRELDTSKEKKKYKEDNPRLVEFWDARDEWTQRNLIWAKYYRPDDYEEIMEELPPPPSAAAQALMTIPERAAIGWEEMELPALSPWPSVPGRRVAYRAGELGAPPAAEAAGAGAGGRRRWWGGGGGRGGGGGGRGFPRISPIPRVDLETPSPWAGALNWRREKA
jgi:hypothetical protein